MVEMANLVLAVSNVMLLLATSYAFSSLYDWKQNAIRKSGIIQNYEQEVQELKLKNQRLINAFDAMFPDE